MRCGSKTTASIPTGYARRGVSVTASLALAIGLVLFAPNAALAGGDFRTDCGVAGIPGVSSDPVVCIGYCNNVQGSIYCVADGGESRFPESPAALGNLSGNVWLMVSDEPTVAQFSRALEGMSGWQVSVEDTLLGRRLSITRRFSTWFDFLDRPLRLRGPGRVRIEADTVRGVFRITEQ